ncbi:MAG TPA: M14 family zinc carboxypeptidase [Thermoanaerobaculia bacterium]|nr:M14 family zinc carboxypeptidase [Thermoanaerobaculia bacterium]
MKSTSGPEPALPIEEVLDPEGVGEILPPWRAIGCSREGRKVLGCRLGRGELHVSLIGGCHADEPVGPEMLRRLAAFLAGLPPDRGLLAAASWWIVPHVNPDGEVRNASWSETTLPADDHLGRADRVFDLGLYLRRVVREGPGDDLEFGFPRGADDRGARPESQAVAAFLAGGGPFHLHGSFHGMGFAPGPWFLIEPSWVARTEDLRRSLRARLRAMGYLAFDADRKGEKGFHRIDEGFSTRPDSRAMAAHFAALGDAATAALFRPSSMELVRGLGGDPFTLVSEMPLFLRPSAAPGGARPDERAERAKLLAELSAAPAAGGDADLGAEAERRGVRGMPIRDQMRLQLAFLNEGLAAVGG